MRFWSAVVTVLLVATVGVAVNASPLVNWKPGPSSPFAYARFDGETVRDRDIPGFGAARTFYLGGRLIDGSTDGSIWSFDGQTYTDTTEDLTIPISNYGIVKMADSTGTVGLYVFGGRNSIGGLIGTVQVYDPMTNVASALPAQDDYPGETPSGCKALPGNAIVVKGRAVVVGGIAVAPACPQNEVTAETWIFNPKGRLGRKWKRGPDLTQGRGYVTLAAIGDKLYAIGGDLWNGNLLVAQVTVEESTPLVQGAQWVRKADLPVPCDESQAFGFLKGRLQDHVILAGCGQWPNALPNSYNYDRLADTWTATDPLNEARRNHAGNQFEGLSQGIMFGFNIPMFVLGGYNSTGGAVLQTSETSSVRPPLGASSGSRRLSVPLVGSPSTY